MKLFNWDKEKNEWLKKNRNISFEEILNKGSILEIKKNPSKKHAEQDVFIFSYNDYAYIVPFLGTKDEYFLKTIFPSRKATKSWLKK